MCNLRWKSNLSSIAYVQVSGELSAASPERLSMASPGVAGGKRIHPLPYASDVNQSRIPTLSLASHVLFAIYMLICPANTDSKFFVLMFLQLILGLLIL